MNDSRRLSSPIRSADTFAQLKGREYETPQSAGLIAVQPFCCRLAACPLPFAEIHGVVIHLVEFRVARREPGMEEPGGVVVRINAGIVGGEMLHLIDAMRGGIGFGLVAEMPLAGKVGRVTVLLEEFSYC
jgi:hypothetical protein